MDLTVRLEHGSMEAEIVGSDREEIQKELLEFKEFLEENEGRFDLEPSSPEENTEQTTLNSSANPGDTELQAEIQEALSPIARATGISESKLSEVLHVDPDGEEDPEILIDDPDEVFGTTNKAKQKPASMILLYLWKKSYDEKEEVSSSDLKDALAGSGIDPSSLFNIYDKNFNKKGPSNSILELSRSGQLKAQEEIQKLVDEVVE